MVKPNLTLTPARGRSPCPVAGAARGAARPLSGRAPWARQAAQQVDSVLATGCFAQNEPAVAAPPEFSLRATLPDPLVPETPAGAATICLFFRNLVAHRLPSSPAFLTASGFVNRAGCWEICAAIALRDFKLLGGENP